MKKQPSVNKPLEALKKLVSESESQRKVAERLDITEQYLSDILRGRRDVSEAVAKALGYRKRIVFDEIRS
jgi:transcriptional regulator with XRE-family HTH domain